MVRGGLYDGEKTKGLLLLLAQEAMATVVCRPPIVFQAEGRARAVSVARAKREGGGAMVTGARTDTQFAAHKSNIISNNNNTKKREKQRNEKKLLPV
jgi:hypothetical protein